MKGVRYSVCALGDTSYEQFCQTGKDIDQRLETLGATRLVSRKDCDVDYDGPYQEWLAEVLPAFGGGASASGGEAAAVQSAFDFQVGIPAAGNEETALQFTDPLDVSDGPGFSVLLPATTLSTVTVSSGSSRFSLNSSARPDRTSLVTRR